MSSKTLIQWCHSTVNPVMGCEGCELWPAPKKIQIELMKLARTQSEDDIQAKAFVGDLLAIYPHTIAIWHGRNEIACRLNEEFPSIPRFKWREMIEKNYHCYAGDQHTFRGANPENWEEAINKGFAPAFDEPKKFPGRVAETAKLPGLKRKPDLGSPWLNGLPRLVFISDMGDALSDSIDFEYLKKEIIDKVSGPNGKRHIWLWLTKRPGRMAEFAQWLKEEHQVSWPDNLVAMTSVTNKATRSRIDQLRKVPAKIRALSVEPLIEPVSLKLEGIDWVIVGGESGKYAREFDISWAYDLQDQCKSAKVAFFVKQLGKVPIDDGFPISLRDPHGGDWDEWPGDLRAREFPAAFYDNSLISGSQLQDQHQK